MYVCMYVSDWMFIRSMYVCMYIIGYKLVDEDLELLYIAGEDVPSGLTAMESSYVEYMLQNILQRIKIRTEFIWPDISTSRYLSKSTEFIF